MKLSEKYKKNIAAGIVGTIVISLLVFGVVVSIVGNIVFTNTFKNVYADTTYHIADTATGLVNGDNIDEYIAGREMDDYLKTKGYLDRYCKRIHVSLIYVIKPDTSDYATFISIFNAVDNTVDNSTYRPWEFGHRRETTNEEYRRKYKAIFEEESEQEIVYRLVGSETFHPHITMLVPVKRSSGEVTAILCVQRPVNEITATMRPYLFTVATAVMILSILLAYIISTIIRNRFVEPVKKVSREAMRFARENTVGEPLGSISPYTELSNLALSIDKMETDMDNYIKNLTAATAEKERINAELSLAGSIQENELPNDFPAFPDRTDFDIFASMTPAKGVGGDFYNFFLLDEDHLAILIGDVSGKGIPGALFMMMSNIILTERINMGGTPAEILRHVNNSICEHNEMDMFVTLWLGIVDLTNGRVIAANAGHEDAALYRSGGDFELFKTKHGLPAGALPGSRYKDFEFQFGRGDKLFIYTDGVPEAMDSDNHMFTIGKMIDTLNENKEKTPEEILKGIHTAVNEHAGEAPQFDDLTMLCFEYLPDKKE